MLNLTFLHHVRLGVHDLAESERFATDFGLVVVARQNGMTYLRTASEQAYSYVMEASAAPRLKSIAFAVASPADLERATAQFGATPLRTLDGPGGGVAVTLTDPDGIQFDLVHGMATVPAMPGGATLPVNTGPVKERKGMAQVPQPLAPAHLLRLGHVVSFVQNLDACKQWYEDVLGLLPTDVMYSGQPDNRVAVFFRLNLGEQWTDHHTLAIFKQERTDCHHLSFEMSDLNAQYRAHLWMKKRGWEPVWGVGRHPLGSHVFDMWRDPDRYRFETYSDTDLLTAATPPAFHDVSGFVMDVWCDESPQKYFA